MASLSSYITSSETSLLPEPNLVAGGSDGGLRDNAWPIPPNLMPLLCSLRASILALRSENQSLRVERDGLLLLVPSDRASDNTAIGKSSKSTGEVASHAAVLRHQALVTHVRALAAENEELYLALAAGRTAELELAVAAASAREAKLEDLLSDGRQLIEALETECDELAGIIRQLRADKQVSVGDQSDRVAKRRRADDDKRSSTNRPRREDAKRTEDRQRTKDASSKRERDYERSPTTSRREGVHRTTSQSTSHKGSSHHHRESASHDVDDTVPTRPPADLRDRIRSRSPVPHSVAPQTEAVSVSTKSGAAAPRSAQPAQKSSSGSTAENSTTVATTKRPSASVAAAERHKVWKQEMASRDKDRERREVIKRPDVKAEASASKSPGALNRELASRNSDFGRIREWDHGSQHASNDGDREPAGAPDERTLGAKSVLAIKGRSGRTGPGQRR